MLDLLFDALLHTIGISTSTNESKRHFQICKRKPKLNKYSPQVRKLRRLEETEKWEIKNL